MKKYALYKSEEESSYSFLLHEEVNSVPLPTDAELIWTVEASSWEIASLKKHEYLGWEPYKPFYNNDEDLKTFLPRDKHDLDNVQLLINIGYPAVSPVLPELFEWIQDMNWPVTQKIALFLVDIGRPILPHIESVLKSNDSEWKYFVCSS